MGYSREKQNEYSLNWAKQNPERVREIKKRSHEKHKARRNAESRAHRAANRERHVAEKRKWEAANPELVAMQKVRKRLRFQAVKTNRELRYHYSVTLAEYKAIHAAQGGVCAICRKEQTVTSRAKRLFVDHCHETGRLRGLLCSNCNMGLGFFVDNLALMKRATAYIKAFKGGATNEKWLASAVIALAQLPTLEDEDTGHGECVEDDGGGRRHGECGRTKDHV